MGLDFRGGTLYMIGLDGDQIELGNNLNGDIEIDTLSPNATPDMSYNFTKDMSASFEMSLQDLRALDALVQPMPTGTFNIEHNVPILVQAKWHKKKRINKKWLKRYGMKADMVKLKAKARTLSYNTQTGECDFEVDKLEYIWRPDQLRKHLKIEM